MVEHDSDDTLASRSEEAERVFTTKLLRDFEVEELAEPVTGSFESNQPPWRIELNIIDELVQVVFDLRDSIHLGRSHPENPVYSGVDLAPFDAQGKGLSRQHAELLLERGNVIIRDLDSLNGTTLNGKRLKPKHKYILHSGDFIQLARLNVRLHFLHNPFASS